MINQRILNVPTFWLLEPPPILSVVGRGRLMCMYTGKREHSFRYSFYSAKFLASQKRIGGKECDIYGETGNTYKSFVENLSERTVHI